MDVSFEILAFVAALASVIISGFAIWLSIYFFRMSTDLAETIKDAARDISAGVERLEKLFSSLYADTFTMMKDTVSDMRKHIWPESDRAIGTVELAEKKADEKIAELRSEMKSEIESIVTKIGSTDTKLQAVRSDLQADIEALIDEGISRSRIVEKETREETTRNIVLEALRSLRNKERLTAKDVYNEIQKSNLATIEMVKELAKLDDEGVIELSEEVSLGSIIQPSTMITIKKLE